MGLSPAPVTLRLAGPDDSQALAALHEAAFAPRGERPWTTDEFQTLTRLPGMTAFLALDPAGPAGMALMLGAGDEAEIAVICVHPERQRLGIGSLLLDEMIHFLEATGGTCLHLEVARDNPAAIALYTDRGFRLAGCRPEYYRRQDGTRVDALVYRLPLGTSETGDTGRPSREGSPARGA